MMDKTEKLVLIGLYVVFVLMAVVPAILLMIKGAQS